MNKIFNPKASDWETILKRPTQTVDDIEETVNGVFKDIREHGDSAVAKYTSIFDNVELDANYASAKEIESANNLVSGDLKVAIQIAKDNIEKFHIAQKTERITVETTKGVLCWQSKFESTGNTSKRPKY